MTPRSLVLGLSMLVGVSACSDPASSDADDPMDRAWSGAPAAAVGKADTWSSSRTYEVLLTDPHCDVCSADDKAWLLARSPIIERVVGLLDGATNTVDAAQFTFSRKEIEAALVRAHARGVTVRLAMDAGQDKPGTVARRLEDGGLDVRFVSGRLAGGGAYHGLQHAKFMLVDGGLLATGSNNWSSTGTSLNEENTVVVGGASGDPLIAGFACHFEAIWESEADRAGACSNDVVAFTPSSHPFKRIRNELRAAKRSVDVLMHHLVFGKLVKELAAAAERGVAVRVVVNVADRQEHSGGAWDRLLAAGGRVRFKDNNADAYQLMHHKLVVIDDALLINGSGNWSGSAFFNNYENYVRYADPVVVGRFVDLFHRLWTWSRSGASLDRGLTAAQAHAQEHGVFFGNLHAHHAAAEGARLLDDGLAEILDASGAEGPVDVGGDHAERVRYAYEYARDKGGLDFMALSPHVVDDRPDDAPDQPNMTEAGYATMLEVAAAVNEESAGSFVGLPSMEWNTNSAGNHVGILGSGALCKTERGRFDTLFEGFLPARTAAGDRPVIMFNHPRTFRRHVEYLSGNWDRVYGALLTDIPSTSQRTKKFNDFGLDDYPPLSEVRQRWIDGLELPDPAVVDATLARIEEVARPYARLMEVTVGRGKELGGEAPTNPSLSEDPDDPSKLERYTKVRSDWEPYLLAGYRLAPVANHDNHRANWGAGHTSRTAILARDLTERGVLDALRRRWVYASEDEDLALKLYADDCVPMGAAMATLDDAVSLTLQVDEPDSPGAHDVTVRRGRVGGDAVEDAGGLTTTAGGWHRLTVDLPEPGRWFVYLEIHEPTADRMAWSAPIWIERLSD